jgi:hypothetical protein
VGKPDRQHPVHDAADPLARFVARGLPALQSEEADNHLQIVLHAVLQFAQHDRGVGPAVGGRGRGLGGRGPGVLCQQQPKNVGEDRERMDLELVEHCLFDRIDFENAPVGAVHHDRHIEDRHDAVLAQHVGVAKLRIVRDVFNDEMYMMEEGKLVIGIDAPAASSGVASRACPAPDSACR